MLNAHTVYQGVGAVLMGFTGGETGVVTSRAEQLEAIKLIKVLYTSPKNVILLARGIECDLCLLKNDKARLKAIEGAEAMIVALKKVE